MFGAGTRLDNVGGVCWNTLLRVTRISIPVHHQRLWQVFGGIETIRKAPLTLSHITLLPLSFLLLGNPVTTPSTLSPGTLALGHPPVLVLDPRWYQTSKAPCVYARRTAPSRW